MTNFKKLASISLTAGLAFACLSPTLASANTAPNPYTPVGQSWINVPEASKVYFESFGATDYDDYVVYYVPTGVTCTSNSVTARGPFLTARDLNQTNCIDGSSNPIDPIDNATRAGATPFGANLNFFGTNYTSAWPNTNGGIYFNSPSGAYNRPMAELAVDAQSSVMFPFGADLFYVNNESNLWTAQTQVDGKPAVIFAWEDFHNCCNNASSNEDMSFQLVLIDLGNGDFNAYFNYDSILAFIQGYQAPVFFVDLETGVTVGSNLVVTNDVQHAPVSCTRGRINNGNPFGTATDSQFNGLSNIWFKQENLASKTISIWSDDTCSTPRNISAVQNVAQNGYAYLEFGFNTSAYKGVATGWATYNTVTKKIDWTELLRNESIVDFVNGGSFPLTNRSLNTTVPGRFVIGQRGGQTVTDSAAVAPPAAPAAPAVVTPPVSAPAAVVTQQSKSLSRTIQFSTSSKVLTKKHKAKLKKSVSASGASATYIVTGTAGFLPGVTEAQVKKLAKVRANIVKAYLIKLGVNKANITIKIKTTNQGIIPKTKTLASYLTS